jgi:hypothetical protein
MDASKVVQNLGDLMTDNGIKEAILIIPLGDGQFSLFNANSDNETLRQLGQMLVKNIPDNRILH